MIRYTVIWDEQIDADFVDAWIKADSMTRNLLTDLANLIDSTLCESPDRKGGRVPDQDVHQTTLVIGQTEVSVFYRILPRETEVRVARLVFRRR